MSNFKNIQVKKYFLYRHIRLDKNVPFYIGTGINNRRSPRTRYYERAFKKDGRNIWWHRIANKSKYEIDILFETDSKEEIIKKEIEFIILYGRQDLKTGTLVNLTEGGEGLSECSLDTRQKISKLQLGNKNSLGCIRSEEAKKKDAERMIGKQYFKGKSHSIATRENMSKNKKNVPLKHTHIKALVGSHPNSKKVYCFENGVTYESIGECIRLLFKCLLLAKDNKYRILKHGISKVCNGKMNRYRNFNFKFI